MTIEWSEYAEDQLTAMKWSGRLGVDDDGYPLEPPHSGSGGLDHVISQNILKPVRVYGCRHCGADIFFKNRLPHSMSGAQHRCLADAAARKALAATEPQK